jgi:alpha-tubulin suppressor-like RCC1 family protein
VGTEHRQLKQGSEGSFSPTPVHVVGAGCGEQVTQVACGKYHCVVRTAAGGVCTWGSARWGLMGTASTDELEHTGDSTEWFQPCPTRVALEGGESEDTTVVVQVAAGGNYSLALDDTGQVSVCQAGRSV